MSFRRRLRTPSFRGVRFEVSSTDRSGGRNVTTHEFVNRSTPYSEDPTRQPRTFSLEAFVQGFDYQRRRDNLLRALEQGGPGELVHPYYGALQVVVTNYRIQESGIEGGVTRFQLDFVEAGELLYPKASSDPRRFFQRIADSLKQNSTTQFLNDFSIARQPQFVVDRAKRNVTDFADLVEQQTSFVTRNADEIADLAVSIEDLRDDVDELINTPALLAERMSRSIDLLSSAITERRETVSAYRNLFRYGDDFSQPAFNTPSRRQVRTNNDAFSFFVRSQAVGAGATSASEIEFTSLADAASISTLFFKEIDRLSLETDNDFIYEDLQAAKGELAKAIPPEGQSVQRTLEFKNPVTRPSVVVAYDLYGDLLLQQDLLARNRIRNPLFVRGGQTLEVLSRA